MRYKNLLQLRSHMTLNKKNEMYYIKTRLEPGLCAQSRRVFMLLFNPDPLQDRCGKNNFQVLLKACYGLNSLKESENLVLR